MRVKQFYLAYLLQTHLIFIQLMNPPRIQMNAGGVQPTKVSTKNYYERIRNITI